MTGVGAADWAQAQLAGWDAPTAAAAVAATRPGCRQRDAVVDWAECGAMALTGLATGPPIAPPGAAATAARGAQLAFAALADRPVDELGDWPALLGERARFAGLRRRAPWAPGGRCRAVACADGWVVVNLARDDDVDSVAALLEVTADVRDAAQAWRLLDATAGGWKGDDLVTRAELLGLPLAVVPPAGDWVSRDRLEPGKASQPLRRMEIAAGPPRPPGGRPLVVDFSALWAGPLCARLLGLAGAEVVKVEWSSRPDGARRGDADFYDALHAGHDSINLVTGSRSDRELLDRLLERADIVIEAARPRALAGLGVDALEVCRRSPTTWVSISAFGRTAPMRVGFGDDVAMAAGLAAWTDGGPVPCGDAIADPLTGQHAAVAALASHRTGGSRIIDVAMSDVAAATVAWRPVTPLPAARLDGRGTWVVDSAIGSVEVREPRAERPTVRAAALGRDTERWRSA